MNKNKRESLSRENLRAEAEKRVTLNPRVDYSTMSATDIASLVHELKTHQIELEMQNDEMRRAQDELLFAHEQYSELYEFAPIGYITTDDRGVIQRANLTLSNMIDIPRSELMNKELQQFFVKDDLNELYILQQKTLKSTDRQSTELRFSLSNGSLWVRVDSTCVKDLVDDNCLIRMVFTDITERKQAEVEQAQFQRELNQANKMAALGQLAGGIAHDFNNILGVILGYSELAQHKAFSNGYTDLNHYLSTIGKASIRGRDLVNKMLAFCRNDVSSDQPLQLMSQINEEIQMIQSMLPSSLKINTDIAEDLPAILMDPIQLNQLLMNLCINARDAMKGQGVISIHVKMAVAIDDECSDCREKITGDWVELTIIDTGGGIAPDVLTKMFNPFFSTKKSGEGAGMGLSTIHGIMHSHNGHICVETELGKGTIFRLLFPPAMEAIDDKTVQHPSSSEDVIQEYGARILVVDDESSLVNLYEEILKTCHFKPTVFTSSKSAFEFFELNPDEFDLLITDQTMPEMSGIDLIKKIRKIRPDLPIILNTGYSDDINDETANILNIRIFKKPVEFKYILNSISELLS